MSMSIAGLLHRKPRAGSVRSWMSRWFDEWRVRRDINAVHGLDDALLHDIGVSRAGIEDAVRHGRCRAL